GVADDARLVSNEFHALGRTHDDASAGHALADAVVGVASQDQIEAADIPRTKTLPGSTVEIERDRLVGHALIAMGAPDLTREARTDGAIDIVDCIAEMSTSAVDHSFAGIAHRGQGQVGCAGSEWC